MSTACSDKTSALLKTYSPVFSAPLELTESNNYRLKTNFSNLKHVSTSDPLCLTDDSELSRADYQKVFKILVENRVASVLMQGGEPFLRQDILPIIKDARRVFITTVLTNGTLLNPEISRTLRKLNIIVVVYTPGFSEALYDSMAQEKGAYQNLVKGASSLLMVKTKPIFLIPVTKPLIPFLAETVKNIKQLGANTIKFTVYSGAGYSQSFRNELSMSPAEALYALYQIERLKEKYKRSMVIYHTFVAPYLANACANAFAIDSHGNIMPCAYLRIFFGNILRDDLGEVHKKILSELTARVAGEGPSPGECQNCNLRSPLTGSPCKGGCRCVAHNLYGDIAAPDRRCPYLNINREPTN